MKCCKGVFEGGGVRGIAHVGAACGMEQEGYRFESVAGSSAGAVVAALIASGYECRELKREMETLNYRKFRGRDMVDNFGTVGKLLSLLFSLGVYNNRYLEKWMEQVLSERGIRTFGDLHRRGRRLIIPVSDLSMRRLLIFPDDLSLLGLNPETFPVARAVLASSSIPVFFEPVSLRDARGREHLLVDGGLLSNFPIWAMEAEEDPNCPTFGFQFLDWNEEAGADYWLVKRNLPDYLRALVSTCMEAIDNSMRPEEDQRQIIWISTTTGSGSREKTIHATDFDLTVEDCEGLFANGVQAVQKYFG